MVDMQAWQGHLRCAAGAAGLQSYIADTGIIYLPQHRQGTKAGSFSIVTNVAVQPLAKTPVTFANSALLPVEQLAGCQQYQR